MKEFIVLVAILVVVVSQVVLFVSQILSQNQRSGNGMKLASKFYASCSFFSTPAKQAQSSFGLYEKVDLISTWLKIKLNFTDDKRLRSGFVLSLSEFMRGFQLHGYLQMV
jgi:hypothetical protein